MLPDVVLLKPEPLFSPREETFFTPETLFLSVGIGQPEHSCDDAIRTLIHEGVHWRQFQGTTFGAFCNWVQFSQELNTIHQFRHLPRAIKRELLQKRAKGTGILELDEDGLPDPPISGTDVERDALALLRMLWHDHLYTYKLFRNSRALSRDPNPPENILASTIADAADATARWHPAWESFGYAEVQHYYTLDRVGKVAALGQELTTRDLLEGAAAGNEVLLRSLTVERRFLLSDEGADQLRREHSGTQDELSGELRANSVWSPRETWNHDVFLEASNAVLSTSYGYALKAFFLLSGMREATTVADLSDFLKNHPVAHPNPDDFEPDGTWYNLIAVDDKLYATEPNHGEIDAIYLEGTVRRIVDISATHGHIVPTALAFHDALYFGNLHLFPINIEAANVFVIKREREMIDDDREMIKGDREIRVAVPLLATVLGIAFDRKNRLYILETSAKNGNPTPGQGMILRVEGNDRTTVIASGLTFPTGMAFGKDGKLYVSNFGFGFPEGAGQIVRVTIPE